MGRRRILYLGDTATIAGGEVSLLTLMRALDRSRFDPAYLSAREGPYLEEIRRNQIPVHLVPMSEEVLSIGRDSRLGFYCSMRAAAGLWPTCWGVMKQAARLEADLIHTNSPKMHLVGLAAGKLARLPVVCHVRSCHHFGLLSWLMPRLADRVICISRAARDGTFRGDGRRANLRLIYNGRDLADFSPRAPELALKEELRLGRDELVVGLVAHLIPWKGHKLFLRAARQVADRRPDVRFLVVGGSDFCGPGYQNELTRLVEELGLEAEVIFAGARSDMPRVYSIIDLLVGASSNEPFGSVLIEAMAMGRPVVATRSGGYPEIVDPGKTGLLVPPDNASEMAKAILFLLARPSRRASFGEAGRARVQGLFSAEAHARQVEGVYDEVLARRCD
jgi:glycosyltransferase involved in cell wall biosynthesis